MQFPEIDQFDPYNPKWGGESHTHSSADSRQVGGSHYKTLKVQPWDAMESWLTREEFIGFLKGNIIKYLARANSGKEDHDVMIGKAGHYQQKLDEVLARQKENTSTNTI